MNHTEFPTGILLKLHPSLLSTSFHNSDVNNLWNGDSHIYHDQIFISLGKTFRSFTHYTLIFSPTHNRSGFIKTDHITPVPQ